MQIANSFAIPIEHHYSYSVMLIYSLGQRTVEIKTFRALVWRLTGSPIKESSDEERQSNDRLLQPIIRNDERELDCSQFNELLLLVNKDRVGPSFYSRFFPHRALVRDLISGVERFQRIAMLRYGNFIHAYRVLSKLETDDALKKELGLLLAETPDGAEPFLVRSPKVIDVDHIGRADTPLVGYLSSGLLAREEKAAQIMEAAAKDAPASKDWDTYTEIVRRAVKASLKPVAESTIAAFRLGRPLTGVAEFRAFLANSLPQISKRAAEGVNIQKIATHNQDIFLTWDHMDIYFATSMRKPWEFYDLYDFINSLMARPELTDLRLRYFDPTQCFTKLPVDKGLVECLMLKRAKVTVYSVQDTDTLGKDSELAATLAQGKPVIAFVPEIDVAERTAKLSGDDPAAVLERLRFVLYADDSFMAETSVEDYQFVAEYSGLHDFVRRIPFRSIPDDRVANFQATEQPSLKRLCGVVASAERRIYDKRATTLKQFHPLALQVHLETGVANGVLVVRKVEECSRLLRSILTRSMDLLLSEEKGMWCLRERISGCIFRVATQNRKIENCFWNFYLRDDSTQ